MTALSQIARETANDVPADAAWDYAHGWQDACDAVAARLLVRERPAPIGASMAAEMAAGLCVMGVLFAAMWVVS